MSPAGYTQGKINWPFAIAASAVIHAAVIGAFLASSGAFSSARTDGAAASEGGGEIEPGGEAKIELPEAPAPEEASGSGTAAQTAAPPRSERRAETASTSSGTRTAPQTASAAAHTALPDVREQRGGGTVEYAVRPGDSLTKIARRHGCSVAELAALNGFRHDKMLNIGEILKVPATERTEREETTR